MASVENIFLSARFRIACVQCLSGWVSERPCKSTDCNMCMFPCPLCKRVQVCPHLRLHSPRNKRAHICIRCMLSAEREQSKKDIRGGQRERGQILHCGVGGRKALSELGSGWKLTEKEFGLVPCGDKSLKIPPMHTAWKWERRTTRRAQGPILTGHERKVCFYETLPTISDVQN